MAVLLYLGYMIGNNQVLVHRMMPEIKIGALAAVAIIAVVYWRHSVKGNEEKI